MLASVDWHSREQTPAAGRRLQATHVLLASPIYTRCLFDNGYNQKHANQYEIEFDLCTKYMRRIDNAYAMPVGYVEI